LRFELILCRYLVRISVGYSTISNDFKKGYQLRTNKVKIRMVVWLQTPTVFWLGGGNHFSQLLNVHVVNDVRQTEIHIAEPLVHEPSAFEVEIRLRS
jgi:hypothetical protein